MTREPMSPDRHRRVKELFQRAEELSGAEREELLASAAGEDVGLLEEVRRLLALSRETPQGFLTEAGGTHAAAAPSVAAGERLGPYEMLAPLAAGGMGEVWRARDPRLGRDVAVKLIPPHLSLDAERQARFEREARVVAALSHPNVLAVYDVGRSGDITYVVTELLEGQPLGERLREGALSVRAAIECAVQIARALSAAHEKGIVHRDLKPDNVFLTAGGGVKLLDFGIAAWRESDLEGLGAPRMETRPHDTRPGTILGTPSYMSPEQVRGRGADHRSDLFALGCVLHEMLTGRRAFERETSAETLAAILKDEPAPLVCPAAAAPAALRQIVARCLEKDPDRRFQSARELALRLDAALEGARGAARSAAPPWGRRPSVRWAVLALVAAGVGAWLARAGRGRDPGRPRVAGDASSSLEPSAAASRLMLAVLPFESIGGDPDQERFADGMTEEMITALGRAGTHRLGVIARTSAMRFKGSGASIEAIGRELGVDYLVEGSVRRQGTRVRIAAKLIQVADETQIWSDSFDGSLQDIFALQSDVARRIAGALSVELVPRFRAPPAAATDARAYDAYLAGRASFYKATEQGWRTAIDHYKEAVALDEDFALAHAGIASGYTAWALWGTTPPSNARANAVAAVARARELEPDLTQVHSTLAVIRMFFEWDWGGAEREFRRAIALNPSDGEVYHWFAHHLLFTGRPAEAVDVFSEARRLDPLSAFHRTCLGGHYVAMGELERAEPLLRDVLDQAPESPLAHHFLGWLHERRGNMEQAIASWEAAARISDIPNLRSTLGYGYARAGRLADARAVADDLERRSARGYVAALDRAKVSAGLGQLDESFAWLDKAYASHDAWLAALKMEPGFDTLREDPRFGALLARIGVAP